MDAKAWDERYAATDLIWSSGPNQFVEAECADLPAGRALDLAAGEGRNAIWLAQHGWQVTAVDFAQAGLDKGRRLAGDAQIDWVCGDAVTGRGLDKLDHRDPLDQREPLDQRDQRDQRESLDHREPLDHRGFDLVVIAYLQLTASERRAALRRAYSLLRAGGTFLLVAHDSTNLTEGTGGPQEPDVLMTAADVLGDLAGEDFEVVRAERVARLVGASDGEERTAYDALVRLVRRT